MFTRTPVVSTPWIGAMELFEGGALAFVCNEPASSSLADAIVATLRDPQAAAARAGRAAQSARTRYSIAAMAGAHAALYNRLMTARTARS